MILTPRVYEDERGCFFESFNARDFEAATGLKRDFVQDNHSRSSRGVLRGLHYQIQYPQGKLVRVITGEVFDVAVDLRRSASTFGKWDGRTLSAKNRQQLWIPEGFGHGFMVTSEWAELLYKTTDYWHPECERVLSFNDPQIGIAWPTVSNIRLSERDQRGSPLAEAETFF